MRRPIVAANFKMHMTVPEVADYAERLIPQVAEYTGVDIVIAPPFTALARAGQAFADGPIHLAAQNVNAEASGAHTGEVSVSMLADVGCSHAIVGHSERRGGHGETSRDVAAKAVALLAGGLRPILCVGESLDDREAGQTNSVIERQIAESLDGVPGERLGDITVAYEPIWAIGTGRTATPEIAQEAHAAIRARLGAIFGAAADEMRIQYGGSVKPDNAALLMAQPDIDGALVGGASLDPTSFAGIVRAAANR